MSVLIHELPSRIRSHVAPLIREARDRQHRRRLWMALVALAVVLFATAGYGLSRASGSHAQAACVFGKCGKALPNPCGLLSSGQVSRAFASKVIGRTSQASGNYARSPSCTWTGTPLTSHYGSPTPSIRLQIAHLSKKTFLRNEGLSKPPPIRTSGVGEVATWSEISQTLNAWQHGYSVSVSIYGPYVTNSLSTAKTLAAIALGHL
jgi:hypothetical protein